MPVVRLVSQHVYVMELGHCGFETRKRDDDDVSSSFETNWQTKQTYYALG